MGERRTMSVPEFFKYNTLISIPLFAIIALLIVKKTPDFSFRNHTFSKSIYFLNHPKQILVFRLNFLLKALLDIGFVLYLIQYFKIGFTSVLSISLLSSAVLFGLLAFFVEGKEKQTLLHRIITYGSGFLWSIGQLIIASLIGTSGFTIFTVIIVFVCMALLLGFLFMKRTNTVVEIICMCLWYIWLIIFVYNYL